MQCDYCRRGLYPVCSVIKERLPGGFAEYIRVPPALVENGTYRLPKRISYDHSTFIEPLACVVRAQRLAGLREGWTLLVMGSGMSGLLHLRLAKARNCRTFVTDLNRRRLESAVASGAEGAFDAAGNVPERLIAENGRKVDVVMLCTSAVAAIRQAWQCVDKGGAVVFFTVPGPEQSVVVPLNEFWTREIRVLTSYYCGPPDITEAIGLIADGTVAVDDLVTHRLPLTDTAKGFQLVMDGSTSMKVIIHPND
jgi:L-iditol 2-dehydrogenase